MHEFSEMKFSVRAVRFDRGGAESDGDGTPTVDKDMNNNRTNA